jgi:hypothetical protein
MATYKTGNPSGTIAAFVTLNIAILVVMLRYGQPNPAPLCDGMVEVSEENHGPLMASGLTLINEE